MCVAVFACRVEKHSKSLAKLLMSPKANGILIVYVASAQEWKRMVSFISETASMALDKVGPMNYCATDLIEYRYKWVCLCSR